MAKATKIDSDILSAALVGYRAQLDQVNRKIQDLRSKLGGKHGASTAAVEKPRRKHLISAEGRARIAAAQRKRWAAMKMKKKV